MSLKVRGRRPTGEVVEFQMEDVGLDADGAFLETVIYGADFGTVTSRVAVVSAKASNRFRFDYDMAQCVMAAGVLRQSLEIEEPAGNWVELRDYYNSPAMTPDMVLAGLRVFLRLGHSDPERVVTEVWMAIEKARR